MQSVTDGESRTTHYTRDQAGRILSETDPAGNTTFYRRDANGQIDLIEFPDGTTIDEEWRNGLLRERVDQDGNITRWAYDDNGFPERIDYFGTVIGDDDDAFRLMTHDAVGRVKSLTEGGINTPEADWRTTQYFYYDAATARDLDQPVRIIDPDGREALYRYDGNNQVTYHRDFSGVETHYQYTPRRQVETKTIVMPNPQDANDHIEYSYHYQYDAEGNLERAEHPGDVVWFYEYDDRNRLERSGIEGTEVVRTLTYDLAGRIETEDDNAGGLIEYRYYADGQVESQINPLGNVESFYYDARGDLDQVQDATRNAITRDYQRDALGRVTAVTDGEGHTQSLQLNGRDLTELTFVPNNPGLTRLTQRYDWRGKVVLEQDITGGERHYRYNDFGELIQATDAEGGVVDHEYDALGRKTKTVDAAGKVTLWEYDQQANRLVVTQTETDPSFTQVRSARTRTSEKVYDLMGRLVAFTDAEQQQWHFEYNQQGLLTVTRNPDGSQLINEYNAAGQLESETAKAAPGDGEPDRITRYTRDSQGRVLTRQAPHYPAGVFDQYDYNGLGQPLTVNLADLTSVTHQYDAAGRKTDSYYPANRTEHWQHDANDNVTAFTDRNGYRWEYRYNADNNRTWAFDPIAVAQGLAYPGGQGTETHYDDLGRPVGSTDPLGNRQSVLLDTEGRITHQQDAYGVAIVTERDAAGRPTAITDRNGATTGYRYNAFGDLETVTDALGNTTYTTYDRLGRAIESTDALGNRVEQAYNHRAQLTAVTDPQGRTTEQHYNGFGNLTAVARPGPQGPVTSRYDWRADNRLTRVTPSAEQAPGERSHYEYDALGRLTGQTNQLNQHWSYDYNDLGQVTRANQPEAGTDIDYRYNGRGQLTERHYRDAGESRVDRLEYDPVGRLRHIDNAALSETYHYDAAGRLDAIDNHSLNQRFELDHDANGRRTLTQATADADLHYERDAQGRIERIVRTDSNGPDQHFELHRDALGRVTQIDYPNQSRRSLEYDALGRVSALHIEHIARTGRYRGQWETLETYQYHYDANGNLTESSRNGQAAQFAYDSLNRLIRADYPKWDDIDYQWDDRGNLVHKATKTHRFDYQYNAANQLVRFEAHRLPGFSCDGTACPTDDDETGSPHWYDYAYNANGQPTELHNAQKGTQQLTHDALGRMTAVINPNGESVHYGYDSRDRRVRTDQVWNQDEDDNSTNSTSTTVSLISAYDGREELGQWLTDNNSTGQPTPYRSLTGLPQEEQGLPYNLMLHQQLFEPSRPELHAAGNKGADTSHLYLYGDHQNSTVQVRDQDSREAMRLGYSPFGQVYRKHNDRTFWKLNSGVNANNQLNALMPYQYTGRYTEAATGLVHLDARWYNPHTQRFVQPDLWNFRNTGLPAEIQHELMRFTGLDTAKLLRDPSQQVAHGYVSGNPLAWTDWLGLCETVGFWGSVGNALSNAANLTNGAIETGYTLASNTVATSIGGVASLGTLGLTWGDAERAEAVSRSVQGFLGYAPSNEHAVSTLSNAGAVMEVADGALRTYVADPIADRYGAAAGTVAYLAPDLLSVGMGGIARQGLRNGGVREASVTREAVPLERQALDLIPLNAGRNRVTLRSESTQLDVDLAGKAHNGIPTPHTKVSPRNTRAPEHLQPVYNTTEKQSTLRPTSQEDIRTVRRYLERQ